MATARNSSPGALCGPYDLQQDRPGDSVLGQVGGGFGHRQGDLAAPVPVQPDPFGRPGSSRPGTGEVVAEPRHMLALQQQNAHGVHPAVRCGTAKPFTLMRLAFIVTSGVQGVPVETGRF
ncbi:hypothetical protein ABT275_35450 [Streptomyces sp. NPDC001185]|uniref:hypothetical protein n=1 Tax=Streptomyces sp. NPDC001185 TaxID=3154380 RepID=UPI00332C9463